jgi:uncharacterized RDD family membrane protein YckC
MSEPARNLNVEQINEHHEDFADFPPAGKNERVLAFLLDGFIYGTASKLMATVLAVAFGAKGPGATWMASCGGFFVFLAYWIYPVYYNGQTLGKKVFKLKTVRSAGPGELSFLQILLRETVGRMASTITLGFGYLMVSLRADRRCLHDLIAKTKVVTTVPQVEHKEVHDMDTIVTTSHSAQV